MFGAGCQEKKKEFPAGMAIIIKYCFLHPTDLKICASYVKLRRIPDLCGANFAKMMNSSFEI